MEVYAAEIAQMELMLEKIMGQLLDSDPDAVLRIEKIFHKCKVRHSENEWLDKENAPRH